MRRCRPEVERRIAERETLHAAILRFAQALPQGMPMRSKDLAQLGEPIQIKAALARLVDAGRLTRVGRGVYMRPVESGFGKRAPTLDQIVAGIAKTSGETIVRHGATCAMHLGLVAAAPATATYLTSGRARRTVIGDQVVELEHAPRWLVEIPVVRAGNVIRALAWLGEAKARQAVGILERRLPSEAIDELAAANQQLPDWLAAALDELVAALRRRHPAALTAREAGAAMRGQ
jgi:hypothetical protein